ncbi:MAG: PEP-CTERM sorting domain-containing protein [Phycisphaerae bacterium]|nr:PEP-CTERM sorting domain-containing protein [Phycisphaerae bacterium]
MTKAKIFTLALILLAFSSAQANILWSNASGTAGLFDWQNGQSLNGLFGDPTLIGGNTLAFFPSNFRAESLDGITDSVYDRLEFELNANSGFSFQNIAISEYGDYGIFDSGCVQVSGSLTVTNLDTAESLTASLSSDLSAQQANDIRPWQAWSGVNIAAADWTHIKITLENCLCAVSDEGSLAFIEKKVLGSAITLQVIPEPATIAILSLGTILAFRNANRRKTDV